jgi:hypothetical protein
VEDMSSRLPRSPGPGEAPLADFASWRLPFTQPHRELGSPAEQGSPAPYTGPTNPRGRPGKQRVSDFQGETMSNVSKPPSPPRFESEDEGGPIGRDTSNW